MIKSLKPAVILFFVDGNAPSPEDYLKAQELGGDVRFRNARAVDPDDTSLEICDGVTGAVPSNYANAYPTAEKAVSAKKSELQKLSSKVGDEAAPNLAEGGQIGSTGTSLTEGDGTAAGGENKGPAWKAQ